MAHHAVLTTPPFKPKRDILKARSSLRQVRVAASPTSTHEDSQGLTGPPGGDNVCLTCPGAAQRAAATRDEGVHRTNAHVLCHGTNEPRPPRVLANPKTTSPAEAHYFSPRRGPSSQGLPAYRFPRLRPATPPRPIESVGGVFAERHRARKRGGGQEK